MSTNLECRFEERDPGEWYLLLEDRFSNNLDPEFDEFGPFESFPDAKDYLDTNFANPGGYQVIEHDNSDGSYLSSLDDQSDAPSP